ncbi:MAG: permease [Myxococcota bacterium]|nr:permease [Myxococcota bacterium]
MLDAVAGILREAWLLFAQMAPYLLLGIAVAGAMHVLIPMGVVAQQLGRPGMGSVFKAAILGVPLPLCSCGVVPVAASLKKSGASPGAVVSFLVTTPTSGVDSMLATYSLLGGAVAVARVIASFVIGLFAGMATVLGLRKGQAAPQIEKPIEPEQPISQKGNPILVGGAYALQDLMGGIARPLAIGTLLGGGIAYFLPPGILGQYVGQGVLSYLIMLAVGIPLYVCASGSIPLAAALLAKGISPGAAIIFLIAGPATNAATVTIISGLLGKRALFIYLAVLILGSLLAGASADFLFETFPSLMPISFGHGHHHDTGGLSVLEIVSGVGLALLVAYHLAMPIVRRLRAEKKEDSMFQLKVPDMTCGHCAGAVKKAVSALDGVRGVDADPITKIVNVDMDDTTDATAIKHAISQAGFHPETL